jgi:hypothetical protein
MKYIQAARMRSLSARRSLTGMPDSSAPGFRPFAWLPRFTIEYPALPCLPAMSRRHAGLFVG